MGRKANWKIVVFKNSLLGDGKLAIEAKISTQVHQQDLKGLIAFCEEHPNTRAIVVSQDSKPRQIQINAKTIITIYPWRDFLDLLWQNELI
ncbi:MAG: hypothetical protein KIT27_00925 [Legionellales bacterium]|nr:hypothetical protein [Legionellales bacterium]